MSASERIAYTYSVKMGALLELTVNLDEIKDQDVVAKVIWDNLMISYDSPSNMIEGYELVRTQKGW